MFLARFVQSSIFTMQDTAASHIPPTQRATYAIHYAHLRTCYVTEDYHTPCPLFIYFILFYFKLDVWTA